MEYLRLLILRSWDRRHNGRHCQLSRQESNWQYPGPDWPIVFAVFLPSLMSDDSWRQREQDLTGKRTTGRTRQQRSSMQRNIEHELDPKNTERCRVVPEAVSLSLPETSQLLPRRTPIEQFQSWTTAKRGLGVFYATCFRVPELESADQESRQANSGHLVSAIRRGSAPTTVQVVNFSSFPSRVVIQSHFPPSSTCVERNTIFWPPHTHHEVVSRFSEAESHPIACNPNPAGRPRQLIAMNGHCPQCGRGSKLKLRCLVRLRARTPKK